MPGRVAADGLRLGRGGVGGYMLMTVSAFLFSGVVHAGLIPPYPRGAAMTAGWMRVYVGGFFWVQGLGFGIEVFAGEVWRRLVGAGGRGVGGRVEGGQAVGARGLEINSESLEPWAGKIKALLVLVWVATWLSITLPLIVPPFRELGYWRVWPVPVSVVNWVMGRGVGDVEVGIRMQFRIVVGRYGIRMRWHCL